MWQHYHNNYNAFYIGYINAKYPYLKLSPDLDMTDWLSRQNHAENKAEEIESMKLSTDAITTLTDKPTCMSI